MVESQHSTGSGPDDQWKDWLLGAALIISGIAVIWIGMYAPDDVLPLIAWHGGSGLIVAGILAPARQKARGCLWGIAICALVWIAFAVLNLTQ